MEPFTDPLLRKIRDGLSADSLVLYRPMDNLHLPRPWHQGRVVLAEELAHAASLEAALAAFEERRWERCRMVVENCEQLGELKARPDGSADYARLQVESFRVLAQSI